MKTQVTVSFGKVAQLGDRRFAKIEYLFSAEPPKKECTHVLLDCSGSMSPYIDGVAEDAKKFIAELPETALVCLYIYSGHGQTKSIAGPVRCDADGRELLTRAIDTEVYVRGTTVFSEPLELTLQTMKRFAGPDTSHNAVLFTDGCPVPTRWGCGEETHRAYEVAKQLREFGAVVSVIGYGVYYDINFINGLMAAAGNLGVYRHIADTDQFRPAIEMIREVFLKTAPVEIDFNFVPKNGKAGRVFRDLPAVLCFGENGKGQTRGIYDGKSTFYVELTEDTENATVAFTTNGKTQILNDHPLSPATPDDSASFVRLLAVHAIINNQYETAQELLDLVQDDEFAAQAGNCYTEDEKRRTQNDARFYFKDRRKIGAGLKAKGPNRNLINLLWKLIEDPATVFYLPSYKRTGELTSDPRVIHPPGSRTLKVTTLQSHKERFNFSFKALKQVKVLPVDENKELIPGGVPEDMDIWRNYVAIKDRNLHVPELFASMSPTVFAEVQAAGVIDDGLVYAPSKVYTLHFDRVPMTSRAWAQPGTLGLVPLLKEIEELEAEQYELGQRRDALGGVSKTGTVEEDEGTGRKIYFGSSKTVKGEALEYYDSECCVWSIVKYAPSDYKAQVAQMDLASASARLKVVRKRLMNIRFISRSIMFACEISGNRTIKWGEVKISNRGKTPRELQYADFEGVKLERKRWTEQEVCS